MSLPGSISVSAASTASRIASAVWTHDEQALLPGRLLEFDFLFERNVVTVEENVAVETQRDARGVWTRD